MRISLNRRMQNTDLQILTLETTCDETAAAVVTDKLEVLGSVVASQEELHRQYGGVVPELASTRPCRADLARHRTDCPKSKHSIIRSRCGGGGNHSRSRRFTADRSDGRKDTFAGTQYSPRLR